MTNPQYTCHECDYDMHDRIKDDPCPECNTPLDARPELPGTEGRSKRGIAYAICAMVILPIVPILTFGFLSPAMATVYLLAQAKENEFSDSVSHHQTPKDD